MLLVEHEKQPAIAEQILIKPWWRRPLGIAFLSCSALLLGLFGYGALKLHRFFSVVDKRIAQGPFSTSTNLFAAPIQLRVGDEYTPLEIAADLHRSGYDAKGSDSAGSYTVR